MARQQSPGDSGLLKYRDSLPTALSWLKMGGDMLQ